MNAKHFLFNCLEKLSYFLSSIGINRKTPGIFAVFNFFHRAFWPYQKIIEVQGSKMFMNPNENSYNMRRTLEDYASNLVHEKATTDLFKKTVKNGDVVVDLGANIGYFSLLASRLTGSQGKVFSFEPEPKNYNYLKKNIELNNYNHAQPFQKAVSDKNGTTKLFICDYDTGHHTINKQDGIQAYSRGRIVKERSIDIETVALDNFLKERTNRVDVIKMDVEGAEMLALSGMDRVLKDNKDIKMIAEFFPLLIEKMGSDPKEFIRRLIQDYGFSIYIIPEDYAALTSDMKKLNSIQDVMSYRKNEEDHINLFLQRE